MSQSQFFLDANRFIRTTRFKLYGCPGGERAYERYAWLVFFIVGLVLLVFTVGYIVAGMVASDAYTSITGMTSTQLEASNPSLVNLVTYTARIAGFHLLGFSVLILAMSYAPYRKGEKWSWYAFWIVPLFFVIHLPLFLSQSPPVWSGVITGAVLIPLSLLALVLPYKKFFPRKP